MKTITNSEASNGAERQGERPCEQSRAGSPNAEVSGPPPMTPESKQSANGGFAAPIC